MKVKELALLVGISVRTLHHYDAIGLLKPDRITESGYRVYSSHNLEMLQQILFFRELGFSLKQIQSIVTGPDFNRLEALKQHREMLLEKCHRLHQLVQTVEKTILYVQGELEMSDTEKFKGFDFSRNPYEKEARQRWGDKAVNESNDKLKSIKNAGKIEELQDEISGVYLQLAELRQGAPDSSEAQEAIGKWYALLQRMGNYSLEAFRGLGQMYVEDERFTKNIDQFGEGLALFMRDAMAIYADVHGGKS